MSATAYVHPAARPGPWADNPEYLHRQRRGDEWNREIGRRFHEDGFSVILPAKRVQASHDDPTDWSREHDLYVGLTAPVRFPGGVGVPWPSVVEVKSVTSIFFTSSADFRKEDFILYTTKKEHPDVWVMVCDPDGKAVVGPEAGVVGLFPLRTPLFKGTAHDKRRGAPYEVWKARREHLLSWDVLVAALKGEAVS